MVWVLDTKGQVQVVKCDVCGKEAGNRILIANEVIAEACDEHTTEVRKKVKEMLKTKPGPPDRCTATDSERKPMPRCKLDDGHEGDHKF